MAEIITNDPIISNATGLQIAEELDKSNALLALMTEGERDAVYSDISQIASIVRNGYGERAFPIGDQIVIPWKDGTTEYQNVFNIGKHENVELQSGEIVPGMYLHQHYASPFGVQFSHQQAFLYCETSLAAGTYYVTFAANFGSNAKVDEPWNFTLTQAVPAGGRLSGLESMSTALPTAWRVKSWSNLTDVNPLETVSLLDGATGTNLGVLPYSVPSGNINAMREVAFGSNSWGKSALRQYLNKSGLNWWAASNNFDIRPNEYDKNAYLTGFNPDFLDAIKPIKVVTALNTISGNVNQTETTYDRFFPLSLEEINATPQLLGAEGSFFPYWRRRLGLNGFASYHPSVYQGYKHYALDDKTLAQHVRLRSAYLASASNTWQVGSGGNVSNGSIGAYRSSRFSPACVIC